MRRVVSVVNHKGGVGKTTTAVSLAAALAASGEAVLLVDFDPQGSATLSLGMASNGSALLRALQSSSALPVTAREPRGLDLVPSGPGLAEARQRFTGAMGAELLKRALDRTPGDWSWVLIDCPPSDEILTQSAIRASRHLVVPVEAHHLGLAGIEQLARTVAAATRGNPDLEIAAVVPCRAHPRRRIHREIVARLEALFPGRVAPAIREAVALAEAPASGKPVLLSAPNSPSAQEYRALALWLRQRIGTASAPS